MKFILTMYICSAIAQQCSSGVTNGTEYNNWNDCLQNGYSQSQLFLAKYTPEKINEMQLLTKFSCTESKNKGI